MFDRVFDASDCFVAGDVPGDAHDKKIADPLVERDLRRDARVGAAEDNGVGFRSESLESLLRRLAETHERHSAFLCRAFQTLRCLCERRCLVLAPCFRKHRQAHDNADPGGSIEEVAGLAEPVADSGQRLVPRLLRVLPRCLVGLFHPLQHAGLSRRTLSPFPRLLSPVCAPSPSLRPDDSLTILTMALSMDSQSSVSFPLAIQATGRLTLALVGLNPPTEYTCLSLARFRALAFLDIRVACHPISRREAPSLGNRR